MSENGAATLAVILGASAFPKYPGLEGGAAFAASARGIKECLAAQLGAEPERLLDLFDSEDEPLAQIRKLNELCTAHPEARRLLIYYVGHGGFFGGQNYYLALRSTEKGAEYYTGLEIRNLALCLDDCFPGKRVVLVLDCCFAAEAAGAAPRALRDRGVPDPPPR